MTKAKKSVGEEETQVSVSPSTEPEVAPSQVAETSPASTPKSNIAEKSAPNVHTPQAPVLAENQGERWENAEKEQPLNAETFDQKYDPDGSAENGHAKQYKEQWANRPE